MRDLLVEVHAVLGPEVVLAEKEPVVGRDDERRVLPDIMLVEIIDQLPKEEIAHRDDGVVVGPQLLAFLRQLVDAAIARPVADRPFPAGVERLLEARGRMERLVRIESLDLEQPVVRILFVRGTRTHARSTARRGSPFPFSMNSRLMMFWEKYSRRSCVNWRSWYFSRSRSQCGFTMAFQGSPSWPRTNSYESYRLW